MLYNIMDIVFYVDSGNNRHWDGTLRGLSDSFGMGSGSHNDYIKENINNYLSNNELKYVKLEYKELEYINDIKIYIQLEYGKHYIEEFLENSTLAICIKFDKKNVDNVNNFV